MPKLRDLRAVDATYATSGPNHRVMRQALPRSAANIFEGLKDPTTWKAFLDIDVVWTSPRPFGVGTTRTITTAGQTIEEVFLVWEQDKAMGFRFDRATLPFAAFAEEWRLEPISDDSCELTWHYAFEWGGPLASVFGWMFDAVFSRKGKRSLAKLGKYAATNL